VNPLEGSATAVEMTAREQLSGRARNSSIFLVSTPVSKIVRELDATTQIHWQHMSIGLSALHGLYVACASVSNTMD
jgi:hypothetical protein